MKKKILMILGILLLTGCMFRMTPSEKVEDFLNGYIKADKEIVNELDNMLKDTTMNDKQKKRYKEVIIDEYSNIKYEIKKETINEEKGTAKVKVDITVKDLYGATKKALNELETNPQKFYKDGLYDESKYTDYSLDLLEKVKDTKDYTIVINLTKNKNKWEINELDEETLNKIHGIYEY